MFFEAWPFSGSISPRSEKTFKGLSRSFLNYSRLSWSVLACLVSVLACLGQSCLCLGLSWGLSWPVLASVLACFGLSWSILRLCCACLCLCGSHLGLRGAPFGHSWLDSSWPDLSSVPFWHSRDGFLLVGLFLELFAKFPNRIFRVWATLSLEMLKSMSSLWFFNGF